MYTHKITEIKNSINEISNTIQKYITQTTQSFYS